MNNYSLLSKYILKVANLETDMAKRVMLSIIPAVSSETERHYTGGFDWLALKSAAAGAKNLIKYGTMTCADEIRYYGKGYDSEMEDISYKLSKHDKNSIVHKTLSLQYEKYRQSKINAADIIDNVFRLIDKGQYIGCLKICLHAFKQPKAWANVYGGEPWAKIADTLLKIAELWEHLNLLRTESNSPKRKNIDYLSEEFKTMKEIVMLMNVFDGLAHNTGNVMPKVISNEYFDNNPGENQENDNSEFYPYKERILNLMDAKELDDPLNVYKQVENIISQNKYMFQDWIRRLQLHPDYNRSTQKEIQHQLNKVKAKKSIIPVLKSLKEKEAKMNEFINQILKAPQNSDEEKFAKKNLFDKIDNVISRISGRAGEIRSLTEYFFQELDQKCLEVKNWCQQAYQYTDIHGGFTYYDLQAGKFPDIVKFKEIIIRINYAISDLEHTFSKV